MNKFESKQKRGYAHKKDICDYLESSTSELLSILTDDLPIKRTISANILGMRKEKKCIQNLIQALLTETKLYPKIAISEALSEIGEPAVSYLIPFLGKIGNNQYFSLPSKPFVKNNYPLARDIISRTICNMRKYAIPILIKELDVSNKIQLSEGIDAIGYISYYEHDEIAKNYLLNLFSKNQNDIITWKLIRSFQAFSGDDIFFVLKKIIKESMIKPFVWEANRSLKQILRRKIENK
jgi:hypothetical protein